MRHDFPLRLAGAQQVLGVSRSKLLQHLKTNPHCRRVGNRYVFDEDHIEALKRSLHEEYQARTPSALPPAAAVNRSSLTAEQAYHRALALVRQRMEEGRPAHLRGKPKRKTPAVR